MTAALQRTSEHRELMRAARLDCLLWASKQPEICDRFIKETGVRLPTSPLDRLIDKQTGYEREIGCQFIAWFDKNVWGNA
jgi:hypothetical protein